MMVEEKNVMEDKLIITLVLINDLIIWRMMIEKEKEKNIVNLKMKVASVV